MKVLIVLGVLAVAVNALSVQEQWTEFKQNHFKTYSNLREEKLRFEIFQDNLRKIDEHNVKYENGEVSYYFAVNKFADMSSEEFMAMLNSQIATKPTVNGTLFKPDPTISVPDAIDWREKGAVLGVKEEGNCRSFWAFSATGALEGQIAITQNKQQSLSEQQLIDCSTLDDGCNGGDMTSAFTYIRGHGICSEESYPYTGKDGHCHPCFPFLPNLKGHKEVAANENALKEAVGTIGPVSVSVYAIIEWQLYGGGVFDHMFCFGEYFNHAVLAVGYGKDEKDYWIIKNSWGTSWGEKGYMRLVRGKNQCGISERASYPELLLN